MGASQDDAPISFEERLQLFFVRAVNHYREQKYKRRVGDERTTCPPLPP